MDNMGREKFWNVLKNLHSNSAADVSMMMDASPWPKTLCRFRPVNEHSLQQLQENKLFFSSADHYDDPFDTYFCIDVDQMVPLYEMMQKGLIEGNAEFVDELRQTAVFLGQNPDIFVGTLSNQTMDFSKLKEQLLMVRNSVQRKLFSICFCEDPYNETLWLKYAENYSGFVQIYDLNCPDTFMCGKEENCQDCIMAKEQPYIYPVYYSDKKYDATRYAVGAWLIDTIPKNIGAELYQKIFNYVRSFLTWEAERVSLIKKKCHEYDQEWRMIRPAMHEQRTCIKMKPSKIIIGLRTPQYKRRLIVSAAKIAGIQKIHELYINDSDRLDSRPISV